jgi:hypothetical protein
LFHKKAKLLTDLDYIRLFASFFDDFAKKYEKIKVIGIDFSLISLRFVKKIKVMVKSGADIECLTL